MRKKYLIIILIVFVLCITGCSKSSSNIENYLNSGTTIDTNSNIKFPKSFGMIGTSEEKKSIAYLYFYDFDLDYIGEKNERDPMANFVKKYFEYDF